MKKRKTLLLIDTSALIHRSYHALPPLMTQRGEMVNAVYGVASTILSVEKEFSPTYIIAAYDVGKPTFRHKAYAGYKATRSKAPDDLRMQFAHVRALMDAFGIVGLEKEGFEADDIIGTVARLVTEHYDDVDVIIVTGDNDALQLVSDRVSVRTFGRGLSDAKIYDATAVEAKYGIVPSQLADYKGLAGDSSDNIPGVRGIGTKTATKLLGQYGSLEGIYAHIAEQKGALRTKLERDRAQAFLSRDLGRIVTDVAITYDLHDARVTFDTEKVRAFFREMNFFSLLKRLPKGDDAQDVSVENERGVRDEKYDSVTGEDVADVLIALAQERSVAVAVAHDGVVLAGFAFSPREGRAHFIPWSPGTRDVIAHFFARSNRRAVVTAFDTKALIHILLRNDIVLAPPYNDVLLQAYVLGAGTAITLERCVQSVLGEEYAVYGTDTQQSLIPDSATRVCATQREADYTYKIAQYYESEIARVAQTQRAEASVATVLTQMEIPLITVLVHMERSGIACDVSVLAQMHEELSAKIARLEEKIYKFAGKTFNINSSQQLAGILFDTLGLPHDAVKKTKTGYSTAAQELAKLHDAHPIIPAVEEYRELYKLRSTYIDALPKLIAPDGRIHTTFQQAVTATGRLSSTDPNLQNIPTRTEYAQRIRTAFIAPDGYVLVSADYSQIDLRCVAHIAQDERMIAAFRRGEDIHVATAMEVFGVTKSAVTKTMRRQAKALNFGLIYGMGAYGFAQSAGISMEEAQEFIARYFVKFSGVAQYMETTIASARKNGYVETLFGRRRSVPEIHSPNQQLARSGERMAINMPVQGMAADIVKYAMIALYEKLSEKYASDDARMILQVHDEIICEVRAEYIAEVTAMAKEVMETVVALRVPLVVETVSGRTWADLK